MKESLLNSSIVSYLNPNRQEKSQQMVMKRAAETGSERVSRFLTAHQHT